MTDRAPGAVVRLVAPEVMRLIGLTDAQTEKVAAAIVEACDAAAAKVLPLAARLDALARLLRAGLGLDADNTPRGSAYSMRIDLTVYEVGLVVAALDELVVRTPDAVAPSAPGDLHPVTSARSLAEKLRRASTQWAQAWADRALPRSRRPE